MIEIVKSEPAQTPRRPAPNPVIEIKHPNYPEIVVDGQRLTHIQQMQERDYLQQYQRAVEITDAAGNTKYNKDGTVAYAIIQGFPPDYDKRYSNLTVRNWRNVRDENGVDIPCTPENHLILSEDWLDVYEDVPSADPAAKPNRKRRTFAAYVGEQLRKPVTDPTTPRSS